MAKASRRFGTASQALQCSGRRSTDNTCVCMACGKVGAEESGDGNVWHWRWRDGLLSTMPRGLKPGLCVPCARAALPDNPGEATS